MASAAIVSLGNGDQVTTGYRSSSASFTAGLLRVHEHVVGVGREKSAVVINAAVVGSAEARRLVSRRTCTPALNAAGGSSGTPQISVNGMPHTAVRTSYTAERPTAAVNQSGISSSVLLERATGVGTIWGRVAVTLEEKEEERANVHHQRSNHEKEEINTSSAYQQRTGTVAGVTMNTLCNVMGAGVLALPLAFYEGSVVMGILLLFLISKMSTVAAHALALGCDAVGKYSYTECVVMNLLPQQQRDEGSGGMGNRDGGVSSTLRRKGIPTATGASSTVTASAAATERSRRILSLLLECIIVLSSCGTLIVYSRVIGDAVPPVLVEVGITDKTTHFIVAWLVPSLIFFIMSCAQTMEELKWTSLVGFITIIYIVALVAIAFFVSIYVSGGQLFAYESEARSGRASSLVGGEPSSAFSALPTGGEVGGGVNLVDKALGGGVRGEKDLGEGDAVGGGASLIAAAVVAAAEGLFANGEPNEAKLRAPLGEGAVKDDTAAGLGLEETAQIVVKAAIAVSSTVLKNTTESTIAIAALALASLNASQSPSLRHVLTHAEEQLLMTTADNDEVRHGGGAEVVPTQDDTFRILQRRTLQAAEEREGERFDDGGNKNNTSTTDSEGNPHAADDHHAAKRWEEPAKAMMQLSPQQNPLAAPPAEEPPRYDSGPMDPTYSDKAPELGQPEEVRENAHSGRTTSDVHVSTKEKKKKTTAQQRSSRGSPPRWFAIDFGLVGAVSTYAMAFGYHFNVPYFYDELKDRHPTALMKTVSNSFPIILGSYVVVGLLGYLMFGADVAITGNIITNFPDNNFFANVGRVGLLVHFAAVYPVISVCARRGLHRCGSIIARDYVKKSQSGRKIVTVLASLASNGVARVEFFVPRRVANVLSGRAEFSSLFDLKMNSCLSRSGQQFNHQRYFKRKKRSLLAFCRCFSFTSTSPTAAQHSLSSPSSLQASEVAGEVSADRNEKAFFPSHDDGGSHDRLGVHVLSEVAEGGDGSAAGLGRRSLSAVIHISSPRRHDLFSSFEVVDALQSETREMVSEKDEEGYADEFPQSSVPMPLVVLEAFVLVSVCTLIAINIAGIGTVIEFMGVAFTIPTQMVVPGVVGLCAISKIRNLIKEHQEKRMRSRRLAEGVLPSIEGSAAAAERSGLSNAHSNDEMGLVAPPVGEILDDGGGSRPSLSSFCSVSKSVSCSRSSALSSLSTAVRLLFSSRPITSCLFSFSSFPLPASRDDWCPWYLRHLVRSSGADSNSGDAVVARAEGGEGGGSDYFFDAVRRGSHQNPSVSTGAGGGGNNNGEPPLSSSLEETLRPLLDFERDCQMLIVVGCVFFIFGVISTLA